MIAYNGFLKTCKVLHCCKEIVNCNKRQSCDLTSVNKAHVLEDLERYSSTHLQMTKTLCLRVTLAIIEDLFHVVLLSVSCVRK